MTDRRPQGSPDPHAVEGAPGPKKEAYRPPHLADHGSLEEHTRSNIFTGSAMDLGSS